MIKCLDFKTNSRTLHLGKFREGSEENVYVDLRSELSKVWILAGHKAFDAWIRARVSHTHTRTWYQFRACVTIAFFLFRSHD